MDDGLLLSFVETTHRKTMEWYCLHENFVLQSVSARVSTRRIDSRMESMK